MVARQGEQQVVAGSRGSLLDRAIQYSHELFRLSIIKDLFGKETTYRLTKDQMFIEALLKGTESTGVKLTGLLVMVDTMKYLSPNDNGKGIDGLLKMLSPAPVMAQLGTAYGEDQPGFFARIINTLRGKGGDNQ